MRTGHGHFPPPETGVVRKLERKPQSKLPGHVHESNPNSFNLPSWPTLQEANHKNRQSNGVQSGVKDKRRNTNYIHGAYRTGHGTNNYGRPADLHGFSGLPNPRPSDDYRVEGHRGPAVGERHSGIRYHQSSAGNGYRGSYAPNTPYSIADYIGKSLEGLKPSSDDSQMAMRSKNADNKSSLKQPSGGIGIGGKAPANPCGYFSPLSRVRETDLF